MAKGWHRESKRHSQAAKGVKTKQKVSPRVKRMLKKDPKLRDKTFKQLQKKGVFLKYQADSDGDGIPNVKDCRPLDPRKQDNGEAAFVPVEEIAKPTGKVTEVGVIGAETKQQAILKRARDRADKLLAEGRKKLKESQEKKKARRIKALESVDHPDVLKLNKQKERVAELKEQIAINEDEEREEKLFNELQKEENQLRTIQEKVTELRLEELSDRKLKTLAIRWNPKDEGLLGGLFGSPRNPYQEELVRRIMQTKRLNQKLDQARKKPVEEATGLFG